MYSGAIPEKVIEGATDIWPNVTKDDLEFEPMPHNAMFQSVGGPLFFGMHNNAINDTGMLVVRHDGSLRIEPKDNAHRTIEEEIARWEQETRDAAEQAIKARWN